MKTNAVTDASFGKLKGSNSENMTRAVARKHTGAT